MKVTTLEKEKQVPLSLPPFECGPLAIREKRDGLSLYPANFHCSKGLDQTRIQRKPVKMGFQHSLKKKKLPKLPFWFLSHYASLFFCLNTSKELIASGATYSVFEISLSFGWVCAGF